MATKRKHKAETKLSSLRVVREFVRRLDMARHFAAPILLLVASQCAAGIFDDMQDIEGKVIIYAGEFEELSCPIGGKYDCLSWPPNFLKAKRKDICFLTSSYSCRYSCKGFIGVAKDSAPYVYIIDSIRGDFSKGSYEKYACPSLF